MVLAEPQVKLAPSTQMTGEASASFPTEMQRPLQFSFQASEAVCSFKLLVRTLGLVGFNSPQACGVEGEPGNSPAAQGAAAQPPASLHQLL